MIVLLAILTVVTQAALAVLGVAWLLSRTGVTHGPWQWMAELLGSDALRLAALVAVVATAGSLYFSESRNFTPCELCWFQRIAIYPLAVVLPIAAVRRDRGIWRYAVPPALLGAAVSTYHVQLERFPDQDHLACSTTVPCTTIWFQEFGYITISVMALTALAAIVTLLAIGARHGQGIQGEA